MASLSDRIRRLPKWLRRSTHQIKQANRARNAKDFARAAMLYARALQRDPDNAPIHVQAGHMFKESGDLIAAERHYLAALGLAPGDVDLNLHLAHFYKLAGRTVDAFAAFQRLHALDAGLAEAELDLLRRQIYLSMGGESVPGTPEEPLVVGPLTAEQIGESGLFDRDWYRRKYPDIGASDPLSHFFTDGRFERRLPGPGFDPVWYVETYPDAAGSGLDPFTHYLLIGRKRRFRPVGPPVYERWIDRYDTLDTDDRMAIALHIEDAALTGPTVLIALDAATAPLIGRTVRALRAQWLAPAAVLLCPTPDCPRDAIRAATALIGSDGLFRIIGRDDLDALSDRTPLVLIDGAVELREHALYALAQAVRAGAALIYCDSDHIDEDGRRADPLFKPAASPELMRQQDYVGPCVLIPEGRIDTIAGALIAGRTTRGEIVRDRFLAADRAAIVHLPFILYGDQVRRSAAPSAGGIRLAEATLPSVSIIIPTRDRVDLLRPCIESLRANTDYPMDRIEIIVVDNGSTEDETHDYLAQAAADGQIRVIDAPIPFNYPILNNMAAETSTADILLLLNNDTEIQDADWLRGLVGYAMQPDVAAVGPKLLYEDGTIQHAGVVLGVGGVAAHAHCGIQHDAPGTFGFAQRTREVAAVTGACLAMRRSVFEEIGGLDPGLPVAFNDVLLCLAAVDRGYRNIYVHDVWVRHYESKTRGRDDTVAKVKVFNREARYAREKYPALFRDDPWYSPNLSFNLEELYQPAFPPRAARPWHAYARKGEPPRAMILSSVLDPATPIGMAVGLQARYLSERGYEVLIGAPYRLLASGIALSNHVAAEEGRDAAAIAVARRMDVVVAHTPNFSDVSRWLGGNPPVLVHYHGDREESLSGLADMVFQKEGRLLSLPFVDTVLADSAAAAKELKFDDAVIAPPGADRLGIWSSNLMPLRDDVRRQRDWTDRTVILVASASGAVTPRLRAELDLLIAEFDAAAVLLALLTADPQPASNLPRGMIAVAPVTVAERQQIMAGADIYWAPDGHGSQIQAIEAAAMGLVIAAPSVPVTADTARAIAREFADAAAAAGIPDPWRRRAVLQPGWPDALAGFEALLADLHKRGPGAQGAIGALLSPKALIDESGLFDEAYYRAHNRDLVGIDPYLHFIENGHWEARPFSKLFDVEYYLKRYPDAARAPGGPLLDYLRNPRGLRDPNPFFSNAAYLAALGEGDSGGRAPLVHYQQEGAAAGLPVGDTFDGDFYRTAYSDVAPSGLTPLAHFLTIGQAEGRQPVRLAPSPINIFDDAAVAQAIGAPASIVLPPAAKASRISGKMSAARFCIALLRARPDLRRRFPRALSDGAGGAFARWLAGDGAVELGLTDVARGHIAAALATDLAQRVRQLYLIRPDISAPNPLAMTPAGAGDFLRWAADGGLQAEKVGREALWWFLIEAHEAPAQGLVTTYLFTPTWQRLFPDAMTVFGRAAFADWLRTWFGTAGAWADPATWPMPREDADQIRAAYHARPAWQQSHPSAFADPAAAERLLGWLMTDAALMPPEARAWLAERDRPALARSLATPGLNMLGHFCYASGLRTSTESLVEGLRRAGGQVALRDVWVQEHGDENRHAAYADLELHDVTIVHTQPEPLFDTAYKRAGLEPRSPRTYRIGYWYWELETIPAHWQQQADEVDEIWTATKFVGDALRQRFDLPVRVIMPGLEHPAFDPLPRAHFGLPEGTFLFLFTFHMASIMERKNPLGLIAAFIAAFGKDSGVGLVLKTSFGHMYPAQLDELREAAAGYNVIIIDDVYTQGEVLALMDACDSYVSLHRSEGYGLTMAEAMLLGKPVIATGYSGNLDFMSADNSLLVKYDLVTLDRDYMPYKAGMRWAHASIPHAAECMRRVRDDPEWARELGRRAQADLRERMSLATCGRKIMERLNEIGEMRRTPGA